ncbi:hypothetical protein GWC95_06095 [Sediminibacterium roseum]|uniref:YhhN-like protein n=1 Tax=Sediminibacterium roseum TaxID=1978412 RepID=A0ABW9ZQU9_9BACT|nr:hypothetical protein [Sediminibacterium roseum]NCI49486.1 hypothetical protein [Sediminibacterium roseum]
MINKLLFFYLDGIAPFLPLSVFLVRYRSIELKGKHWALLFFVICCVGFLTADYIYDKGDNNLRVYNVIPLLWTLDMFFFFRQVFRKEAYRYVNAFLLCAILVLYATSTGYFIDNNSFASIYYISFSLFILINVVCYYIQEFTMMEEVPVWRKKEFWFLSVILFYAAISAVIWSFFKMLVDRGKLNNYSNDELKYVGDLWKLHNFVFAFSCIIFSIILFRKK